MELSRNDVIVMATDGLWDVVTNKVIVDVNLMHVTATMLLLMPSLYTSVTLFTHHISYILPMTSTLNTSSTSSDVFSAKKTSKVTEDINDLFKSKI